METTKLSGSSRSRLQIWQIAKINYRHNFFPHLFLAILLLLLTPILFGIKNLDVTASAIPLEMFVALIGVILITPVFQPEQNSQIAEITASKYVSSFYVYIIRIIYSMFTLTILITIFGLYMKLNRCEITFMLIFGTMVTALFLGSLGMLSSALSNNIAVSYMIPVIYYTLNLLGGDKLGKFYLFSMTRGSYNGKLRLLVESLIILIAALVWKWSKSFLIVKH